MASTASAAQDYASPKPAVKKAEASSKKSAADRRRASSEFEREKLDSGAFAPANSQPTAQSRSGKAQSGVSALRFIFGLAVVIGLIYAVHWLLKRWGQSRIQGVGGSSGIINVVATTPLAQGRALHLVRVGEELVLVGATDQSITRIGEMDAALLEQITKKTGSGEFQSALDGALLGSEQGDVENATDSSSAKTSFLKRFIDNLRMSTAR